MTADITEFTRPQCGGGHHLHIYSKGRIAPGAERLQANLPVSFFVVSVCIPNNIHRSDYWKLVALTTSEEKQQNDEMEEKVHVAWTKCSVPAVSPPTFRSNEWLNPKNTLSVPFSAVSAFQND